MRAARAGGAGGSCRPRHNMRQEEMQHWGAAHKGKTMEQHRRTVQKKGTGERSCLARRSLISSWTARSNKEITHYHLIQRIKVDRAFREFRLAFSQIDDQVVKMFASRSKSYQYQALDWHQYRQSTEHTHSELDSTARDRYHRLSSIVHVCHSERWPDKTCARKCVVREQWRRRWCVDRLSTPKCCS